VKGAQNEGMPNGIMEEASIYYEHITTYMNFIL
jgi:hypothetical protein